MSSAPDLTRVGIAIGHATDLQGGTGCTVVRPIRGAMRGAACVFGRATGTREIEALSPTHHSGRVDAILLTGGSAYGLDAAAGVMRWMEERRRGFEVPGGVVPIVPGAVIFDLPYGSFTARPTPEMAYTACESATPSNIAEGSVGAGTGATVGKGAGGDTAMKGGFGCVVREAGGVYLAAMAVVNALGDVRSADGAIIAGARDRHGTFLDSSRALSEHAQHQKFGAGAGHNTTLCVVATNASLERSELAQLARAAGAALFRRITPVGTSFDGDVIFALATPDGPPGTLMSLEIHAVAALEDAIERGVRLAAGGHNVPGLADRSK